MVATQSHLIMKFLTLSVLCSSVLLFQGLQAEVEVESVRQATIPSKKVIQKKPVGEVKSVDAAKVPPPPPVTGRKATEYVDPFSGGTGGFGGRQKNRRADVSVDDGAAAEPTDDILTRILSGRTGNGKKASGAASGGDFGKTIRQMTEEITKNLGKEGGGLEKMLEHPSVRQATEAISKVLTAPAADGADKKKSLRQLTEEVMKNIDVGEVMKGIDVGEVMKAVDPELLKSISPELMKGFSPEMLKNFSPEMLKGISPEVMKNISPEVLKGLNLDGLLKDLPKGGNNQQKKGGKEQPNVDYAALIDSFLGNGGKAANGPAGKKQMDERAYRKPVNASSSSKGKAQNTMGKFFDSYDSSDDDWFSFFGKDDF